MTTQDGAGQELRISADSHVSEPPDLWRTRLPARFRDLDQVGRLTERIRLGRGTHYRAGGWDVDERLRDMAADGIAAEVLYPTVANSIYRLVEPGSAGHELAEACSQAYNDWMIEYCGEAPDRLWGLAHLSLWDVDAAVRELERCKRAGLVGATIWVVPPEELPFTSLHYEAVSGTRPSSSGCPSACTSTLGSPSASSRQPATRSNGCAGSPTGTSSSPCTP